MTTTKYKLSIKSSLAFSHIFFLSLCSFLKKKSSFANFFLSKLFFISSLLFFCLDVILTLWRQHFKGSQTRVIDFSSERGPFFLTFCQLDTPITTTPLCVHWADIGIFLASQTETLIQLDKKCYTFIVFVSFNVDKNEKERAFLSHRLPVTSRKRGFKLGHIMPFQKLNLTSGVFCRFFVEARANFDHFSGDFHFCSTTRPLKYYFCKKKKKSHFFHFSGNCDLYTTFKAYYHFESAFRNYITII